MSEMGLISRPMPRRTVCQAKSKIVTVSPDKDSLARVGGRAEGKWLMSRWTLTICSRWCLLRCFVSGQRSIGKVQSISSDYLEPCGELSPHGRGQGPPAIARGDQGLREGPETRAP
eukprot:scaffold223440_cov37-Tisochrysis_lutea.AAC.3